MTEPLILRGLKQFMSKPRLRADAWSLGKTNIIKTCVAWATLWALSDREMELLATTRCIWVSQLTGRGLIQPLKLAVERPFTNSGEVKS